MKSLVHRYLLPIYCTCVNAPFASAAPEIPETLAAMAPAQCRDFQKALGDQFSGCRVSEMGFVGSVHGRDYYYVSYCVVAKYGPQNATCTGDSLANRKPPSRALAIFDKRANEPDITTTQVHFSPDVGALNYKQPTIVLVDSHEVLYVPIEWEGTGRYNASEYYVWAQQWQRIESENWVRNLSPKLPADREVRKGLWPETPTQPMMVTGGLYKNGDPNCCPTGGTVRVQLSIEDLTTEDRRLVIEKMSVAPATAPQKPANKRMQ